MMQIKEFYMVYNATTGYPPAVQHPTLHEATAEAQRLAQKHPGHVFVVLYPKVGYMIPSGIVQLEVVK